MYLPEWGYFDAKIFPFFGTNSDANNADYLGVNSDANNADYLAPIPAAVGPGRVHILCALMEGKFPTYRILPTRLGASRT